MLQIELRKKVDMLWNKFWAGGLANPLMAIDQMNYLIFLKRLEDMDNRGLQISAAAGSDYTSVFRGEIGERARWSFWSRLPGEEMLFHVQQSVFPWLKSLAPSQHAFTQHMSDASFLIQKPSLLVEAVNIIDDLAISEQNVDTQGDIYEYMLSRLSVAGQIGQFRTPRHIIRAMVALADPAVGQVVVDPACGTGGFLIAAYQHIIEKGTSADFIQTDEDGAPHGLVGDRLSRAEWQWLKTPSFSGYDFDPSMVRIAAMNMVLHGVDTPNVTYGDALGKSFDHSASADIVLANPPFSGTVDTSEVSDDFRLPTKKTELLFMQLFEDLLKPGGIGVVIVPQGVLLANNEVPTEIRRRLLVENTLEAVISLPHSTFKPYASVATAILIFRKGGSTDRVWMYRVDDDGFSQNAARTPVALNDLPEMLRLFASRTSPQYEEEKGKHRFVSSEEIRSKGFELAPNIFLTADREVANYPVKTLHDLVYLRKGTIAAAKAMPGDYRLVTTAEQAKTSDVFDNEGPAICVPMVSSTGHGHASIKRLSYVEGGKFAAATIMAVLKVRDESYLLPEFLYYYLASKKDELLVALMRGAANVTLSLGRLSGVEIPVPPIEQQREFISGLTDVASELTQAELDVVTLREQMDQELEILRSRL